MLILSYCHRTSCADLPDLRDPLLEHLPPSSIEHASGLVGEVQRPVPVRKKKPWAYHKITNEEWAAVSKHVGERGNTAAVHHFYKDYAKPASESTGHELKEEKLAALQRKLIALDQDLGNTLCTPSWAWSGVKASLSVSFEVQSPHNELAKILLRRTPPFHEN